MNKKSKAFFIVAILLSLSAIHLTIYNQNINRSYEILKIQKKLAVIRNGNRFLNYKVAKKESLSRIEKIATTKLNMVYPKEIKYLQTIGSSEEAGQ
ncbi:hypothetical protein ACFLZ2_02645 [Candidatus Margulisiibacteriota bacterium]